MSEFHFFLFPLTCAMQGGLEADAVKAVLVIYGAAFRSRVYQWFHLARALDAEKRAIIKKYNNGDFNQAWIIDNKFLIGEGVDAKFVLKAASFEMAISLAP